jgi:hypothetical protein
VSFRQVLKDAEVNLARFQEAWPPVDAVEVGFVPATEDSISTMSHAS